MHSKGTSKSASRSANKYKAKCTAASVKVAKQSKPLVKPGDAKSIEPATPVITSFDSGPHCLEIQSTTSIQSTKTTITTLAPAEEPALKPAAVCMPEQPKKQPVDEKQMVMVLQGDVTEHGVPTLDLQTVDSSTTQDQPHKQSILNTSQKPSDASFCITSAKDSTHTVSPTPITITTDVHAPAAPALMDGSLLVDIGTAANASLLQSLENLKSLVDASKTQHMIEVSNVKKRLADEKEAHQAYKKDSEAKLLELRKSKIEKQKEAGGALKKALDKKESELDSLKHLHQQKVLDLQTKLQMACKERDEALKKLKAELEEQRLNTAPTELVQPGMKCKKELKGPAKISQDIETTLLAINQKMKVQIASLQSDKVQAQEESQYFESRCAELEATVANLRKQVDHMPKLIDAAKASSTHEVNRRRMETEELQLEFNSMRCRLQQDLDYQDRKVQDQNKELSRLRNNIKNGQLASQKQSEEVQRVKAELQAAKSQASNGQIESRKQSEELQRMKTELQTAKSQAEKAELALNNAKKQIRKMEYKQFCSTNTVDEHWEKFLRNRLVSHEETIKVLTQQNKLLEARDRAWKMYRKNPKAIQDVMEQEAAMQKDQDKQQEELDSDCFEVYERI